MRALELHGKRPAFTRVKLRNLGAGLVFAPRSIPAEREPRRHDRAGGDDSLDRERQTRASRSNLRQLVDDADDIDVAAFPGGTFLIADVDNCLVRKVSGGVISTVAGVTTGAGAGSHTDCKRQALH